MCAAQTGRSRRCAKETLPPVEARQFINERLKDISLYRLIGGNASPYSQKLRAIMRYRRIPHIWVLRTLAIREQLSDVRPMLVPILEYPDETRRTDSTPLVLDLEERHPDGRRIQPDDPALAFLSHLIEDMANERLTKCMFHYRFAYPEGQSYGPHWVIDD